MTNKSKTNPLRAWFEQSPKPMLQKDFAKKIGVSQSFVTSLLSDRPPWPLRHTMRAITKVTKGAVTADMWVELPEPPPQSIKDREAIVDHMDGLQDEMIDSRRRLDHLSEKHRLASIELADWDRRHNYTPPEPDLSPLLPRELFDMIEGF